MVPVCLACSTGKELLQLQPMQDIPLFQQVNVWRAELEAGQVKF